MYILKKCFFLISVLALVFCTSDLSYAQSIKSHPKNTLTQFNKSDNSVDYQSVAAFKTIARKKEYRLGEFIVISVAMLNKSNQPIYFLELDNFTKVLATNADGNKIKSNRYIYPLYSPNFILLNKDEYYSHHFIFLIGCEKEDFNSYKSMTESFNSNDFNFYGRGCIDAKKPGKYLISAEISNRLIQTEKAEKTAVGTIESTPFEITIIGDSQK